MKEQFCDLKPGDRAKIIGFGQCDKAYRQRLLSMGLTIGSVFSVLRKAPLGDPFHIEIRGSSLSLRKAEASLLDIEKLDSEDCENDIQKNKNMNNNQAA